MSHRGEDGNMENTPNIQIITEYYEQIHKWSMVCYNIL